MSGIDRRTGKLLGEWSHVLQSLEVIMTTRIGSRLMRRRFGSEVPGILGQNMTPSTMLRFMTAYVVAVELWEPRFRVRRFSYPAKTNGVEAIKQGRIGLVIEGDYLPNALQGDVTTVATKLVTL
jgi:hypothetical protein